MKLWISLPAIFNYIDLLLFCLQGYQLGSLKIGTDIKTDVDSDVEDTFSNPVAIALKQVISTFNRLPTCDARNI